MATMDAGSVTSAVYQSLESFWPGVLVSHISGGYFRSDLIALSWPLCFVCRPWQVISRRRRNC